MAETPPLGAFVYLDGGVKPEMVATDNASYSDMGVRPVQQVRAYDLLRMVGRDGRPTPLGADIARLSPPKHRNLNLLAATVLVQLRSLQPERGAAQPVLPLGYQGRGVRG